MWICAYLCTHECRDLRSPEELDPMELELQVAVNDQMWMLGVTLW